MRYLSVWLCAIVATVATPIRLWPEEVRLAAVPSAHRGLIRRQSRLIRRPSPPNPGFPHDQVLGTIRSEQEVARQRQQLARQQRQHRNLFWTAKETFLLPSLRRQFDNVRPADPAGLARPF
jgi:hypothetical protein